MHIRWISGLVAVMLAATAGHAQTAGIGWDAVTDSDLAGYNLYRGTASGTYGTPTNVGNVLSYVQTLPADCTNYYWAVKARDTSGNVSAVYSNEVSGWARVRITSASPTTVQQGTTTTVTLTGANFQPGVVTSATSGITFGPVTVLGCTSVSLAVTVATGATTGLRTLEFRRDSDRVYGTGAVLTVTGDTVPPQTPANNRRNDARPPQ